VLIVRVHPEILRSEGLGDGALDEMRIEAVAENLVGQRDRSGAFGNAFSIRKWAPRQLVTCRGQPCGLPPRENHST
jgi:hypothetical protein